MLGGTPKKCVPTYILYNKLITDIHIYPPNESTNINIVIILRCISCDKTNIGFV